MWIVIVGKGYLGGSRLFELRLKGWIGMSWVKRSYGGYFRKRCGMSREGLGLDMNMVLWEIWFYLVLLVWRLSVGE